MRLGSYLLYVRMYYRPLPSCYICTYVLLRIAQKCDNYNNNNAKVGTSAQDNVRICMYTYIRSCGIESVHAYVTVSVRMYVHTYILMCVWPSSSGPILALVLAKENAIADWRKLLGPTSSKRARQEDPESLRAKYGTDDTRNGLHGSDSQYSAEKEIRFIFPGSESGWAVQCTYVRIH